jgi:hypothetical protein
MRPAFGPCKAHGPAGVRPATSARIAILQVGLTGGVRPVRARRQWSRSHPFPFPLPALIIGEEKAKCKGLSSVFTYLTDAARTISASSPSISRNCFALTKPMFRPAFFVSKIHAICSISRRLEIRLSS